MDKVLIVDDDLNVCDLLDAALVDDGFDVRKAPDIKRAREILEAEDVSVCLVDLGLRGGSGLELVKELSGSRSTGVIIVSGRADTIDRVMGLEFGADDYVTKPFNIRELSARVRRLATLMRRIKVSSAPRTVAGSLQLGRWAIDPIRYTVTDEGGERVVSLSKPEVRTLATLVQNRGAVLSRDQIHASGGRNTNVLRHPDDRRIDVDVSSIRKKLGRSPGGAGDLIRTVHGVGYIVD